jgi:hypothetical protein
MLAAVGVGSLTAYLNPQLVVAILEELVDEASTTD